MVIIYVELPFLPQNLPSAGLKLVLLRGGNVSTHSRLPRAAATGVGRVRADQSSLNYLVRITFRITITKVLAHSDVWALARTFS